MSDLNNRRELATRKIQFFHKFSKFLVSLGLHPNHVSVMSSMFGLLAGAAFYKAGAAFFAAEFTTGYCFLFLGVLGIQLRLLCNMIDGLMAVEGGLKTATGELYNDVPDRLSDLFIIAGFGLGGFSPTTIYLGLVAAVGAIMTAYIRVLGASMGAGHFFSGPMAKQHRMFFLTVAAIAWGIEEALMQTNFTVTATLWILIAGTIVTSNRRLRFISQKLKSR
jgi:phosphatidylglycerophosphate synthase